MSQSSSTASLIRVSVVAGTRRADLGLPGGVPVAELVPELARELGALDVDTASRGFRLVRHDGAVVDNDRSLAAQGVEDGFVLSLEDAGEPLEVVLYDDVVEAVSDLVESQFRPWTSAHSARSALGAAVVLFLAAAFALVTARDQGALVVGMAAAAAALILVTAAVLDRSRGERLPATALFLVAPVYGGVAGFAIDPTGDAWGRPLLWAGTGALLVALVGAAVHGSRRTVVAGAALFAAVLAVVGALVGFVGWQVGSVAAVVLTVTVVVGNLLPWLAVSSTRLSAGAPRSEAEIFGDVEPVERAAVARQVTAGHELMVVTGVVAGALALVTIPPVVGTGIPGTALAGAAAVAALLRTRHHRTRVSVLVAILTGVLSLAVGATTAALVHPTWRPVVGIVLAAGAAVVVALALVAPRARVRLGRLGDALDVVCIVAAVPLALFVIGVV